MGLIKEQLHIGGMTCVNCQNKIETGLRKLNGIEQVSVSYQSGSAHVAYDASLISFHQIEKKIEELGYEVLTKGQAKQFDISRTISILAIIISLYVLLQQFGVLNMLAPSRLTDSSMGYGMLFVVGLLTSVHCIAMCGGINLSQCLPRQDNQDSRGRYDILPSLFYSTGRVVSYTVVGFCLGLVGMMLGGGSDAGIPVMVQGILKLLAGGIMVVMGINMLNIFPWLRRWNPQMPNFVVRQAGRKRAAARQPFVIGLLNGLMPCGPLQSIQIMALASGSPFTGALSMLLFSLGTVPLMPGLGTLVSALGRKFAYAVMNVGAVLVAVLGLSMLSQGGALSGMLLPDQLFFLVIAFGAVGIVASVPVSRKMYRAIGVITAIAIVMGLGTAWQYFDSDATVEEDSTVRLVDGVQIVDSTLSPGSYPTIMVQAGIPVRWTINAPGGSINGCNYRVIIQEYGIEYSFVDGENIIEFIPTDTGEIPYTCWMGMIRGNIIVM